MKLKIIAILFFPLCLFSQDFNQVNIKYQDDVDSLIIKHQKINYAKNITNIPFKFSNEGCEVILNSL